MERLLQLTTICPSTRLTNFNILLVIFFLSPFDISPRKNILPQNRSVIITPKKFNIDILFNIRSIIDFSNGSRNVLYRLFPFPTQDSVTDSYIAFGCLIPWVSFNQLHQVPKRSLNYFVYFWSSMTLTILTQFSL